MATLTLTPNQPPLRLTLKQLAPIEKPGEPIARRYLYLLTNRDGIYLPPLAHAEIQALRPEPGEAFLLGSRVGQGNAVEYFTERLSAEPERKPVQNSRSITLRLEGDVPIPPDLTTPESQRIFLQLVATIQAAKAAEAFAKSIDYPVNFKPEDLRAMAISGFIEQSRGKRYAA